ncbi:MAG: aminotransferase class I/II-fold pyridoxal phosphate-dependent enzyme [Planctomycetota bacterium]
MIPLAVPHLAGNESAYLSSCIESGYVSSVGPFVERFERASEAAFFAPAACAVTSGTAALRLALTVLGVRTGDLVVTQSFTFIASANAITHAGATPWLFDVDPTTWTLDAGLLERELAVRCKPGEGGMPVHTETGRRIGAILPVHTLGIAPDLPRIREIANRWNLPVISDAAAAHGSRCSGDPITRFADAACYSFNGNKTVTAGGGGVVTSANTELIQRAKHLSSQARVGTGYDHDAVGFNDRMTNLQAAVGVAQLEQLDGFLAAKRRIRDRYDAAFERDGAFDPFPRPAGSDHCCWLSGVVLDRPASPVAASLAARGVGARPFWKPVHLQRPYADAPKTTQHAGDAFWDRVLTLPSSTSLTEAEQTLVTEALFELCGSAAGCR